MAFREFPCVIPRMPPMSLKDASPGQRPADRRETVQLLKQFDAAWHNGFPAPRIEDFLAMLRVTGSGADGTVSREELEELFAIEMAHRWRLATSTGANPWLLEQYIDRYPELGPLKQLSVEVIAEEYWARRRWGDRPSHEDYARRFPHHAVGLVDKLSEIDAELAAEFDPRDKTLLKVDDGQKSPPVPAVKPAETGAALVGGRLHPAERCVDSVADLLASLRQSHLLDLAQLNELIRSDLQGHFANARILAGELLKRDWLTPFQANQLLLGRDQELVVGPYLLLQRLGEGGAGQVYKARHQKMDRLVALKVIRKDLLADGEAVGRFRREIEVLSRLDHPNVVHAYDAGPLRESYFLAMEYVEGTDLGRLVKQTGPLPVMQACAYVRQAALGLQHAHERGLVHRDVKPHNLILSLREGRIKVADLGLARLPRAANEEVTAALTGDGQGTSLTPVGATMMGTLDYLAPEQALDFHQDRHPGRHLQPRMYLMVSVAWPAAFRGRHARGKITRPSEQGGAGHRQASSRRTGRPVRSAASDAFQATRGSLSNACRGGRGNSPFDLHIGRLRAGYPSWWLVRSCHRFHDVGTAANLLRGGTRYLPPRH